MDIYISTFSGKTVYIQMRKLAFLIRACTEVPEKSVRIESGAGARRVTG